ncbi:MAG TPA: GNAT family N-acetyltransferase [Candidatus Competibacteraceae bacterium]|nr:GNAT family N-acetyltransferase [Candidatus Competibacteraceae bacterium]
MTATLERIALTAWPALREEHLDGWRLRFAEGYSKRVNAVTPLPPHPAALEPAIDHCEARYRAAGLRCLFRLVEGLAPEELDQRLAARGYRLLDPTAVMTLALDHPPAATEGVALHDEELADWLVLYARATGKPLQGQAVHAAILSRITARRRLVSLRLGGEPAGCALAVLDGAYLGLFDLAIVAARRGQGLGARLLAGLLAWGAGQGARLAYLQVLEDNAAALALYRRLGFRHAYRYWYRSA